MHQASSLQQLLPHLLHQLIRSRAILHILLIHMNPILEFFLGMVGEAGAVGWTNFVYRAVVILQIQELARLGLIHPITASVFSQPFLAESFWFHFKMRRDSLYICRGIGRRHGFATVRTTEAICFSPYFLICCGGYLIKTSWWLFLQLG